jgi:hypothetical protein
MSSAIWTCCAVRAGVAGWRPRAPEASRQCGLSWRAYAYRQRFTITDESKRATVLAEELGIHLSQDAEVEIDEVRFLGSTLWTDYQIFGRGTLYMRHAKRWMNDHRMIFPTEIGKPPDPMEAFEWHLQSRAWLMFYL